MRACHLFENNKTKSPPQIGQTICSHSQNVSFVKPGGAGKEKPLLFKTWSKRQAPQIAFAMQLSPTCYLHMWL